jgi:hypothetical protein
VSSDLPQVLAELVVDLQDRGFVIAHEVPERISGSEDTFVVLELSDGLEAGGKVLLARTSGKWEVFVDVGRGNFWPAYSVSQATRGQLSQEPPYIDQTHEERRVLTLELLDRLHGDPNARRTALEAARRWVQNERRE